MRQRNAIWAWAMAAALCWAAPMAAQTVQPVIRVNDAAITAYEIEQRARLLAAFGAAGDVRIQAREQLIEDRLKMAVVDRLELRASAEEVDAGVADFAARRELELDQVLIALNQRGIDEKTLRDFIEVGLSWRDAVQAIFRGRARPSEQDLDSALDFANSDVQESVLLQEIVLGFEESGGEAEVTDLARRLSRQLNRGGSFDNAVNRYSDAPSRVRGGRLDWVPARELPPAIANQVLALTPGEVTAPVPVRGGLSIYKLRDIRTEARTVTEAAEDTVTFFDLVQALPADASPADIVRARDRAREVRGRVSTCGDLEPLVAEFDAGSGRSAPTPIAALPAGKADQMAVMTAGDVEIVEEERGIVLTMLCARAGDVDVEEREAMRLQMFNQRMNNFAQGFLQELRGTAVIVEQ